MSPLDPTRPPLPSPSVSPSLASLLTQPTDDAPSHYEPTDYFSPSALPLPIPTNGATPSDVFGQRTASPTPSHSNSHQHSFSNLLAPDPTYTPPGSADGPTTATSSSGSASRPRSSHKRPRPTSSGSVSSALSSGGGGGAFPGAAGAAGGGGEDEEEGAMEPPTQRVRRSSSISSNPSSAPPPSSRRSASPSRPAPPPPPPHPAPAAAPPPQQQQPPPPSRAPMQRRPSDLPLEPSIFNVEPIDEFTREVADWLWGFCAGLDWDKVEIEAKIGLLVDSRANGARVHLPVPIETILTDDTGLRFQSNMTVNQHKSFNRLLNSRVEETASPQYPSAPVRYAHTRELDTFHELSVSGVRRKIRVTKDAKGRAPPKAVEKVRVADMNVYSPKRMFDWRVSVSLESPAPIPDTPPTHSRAKDRISYTHQLFTVDLTQVSTPPPPPAPGQPPRAPAPPTHELEIEVRNARQMLEEAAKEQRGEEGRYLEMVQGLLNNVRMLIRNASEP
ncbi:hypothetical protein JCM10207_005616 [Rhodosporidiobolus poonsookiae]